MNKSVSISKSNGIEIRNYEKSDLPFDHYFDTTKKQGAIFLVNKHSDVEVLFITDGNLKIHLNEDIFTGETGDIIVINPNVLHNIIAISKEVTYECLIIDKLFLEKNGLSLDQKHINEIIKDDFLFSLIKPIKASVLGKHNFYRAKANIDLLRLCVGMFENYSVSVENCSTPGSCLLSIEKSINYINKHFNDPDITIDEISQHIGYSKFYFCRKFKEVTGYTPTVYVNMQRIKYAYNRLRESNNTVNNIAFESGFKSLSYFSVTFKKYIGINPSSVREINNK